MLFLGTFHYPTHSIFPHPLFEFKISIKKTFFWLKILIDSQVAFFFLFKKNSLEQKFCSKNFQLLLFWTNILTRTHSPLAVVTKIRSRWSFAFRSANGCVNDYFMPTRTQPWWEKIHARSSKKRTGAKRPEKHRATAGENNDQRQHPPTHTQACTSLFLSLSLSLSVSHAQTQERKRRRLPPINPHDMTITTTIPWVMLLLFNGQVWLSVVVRLIQPN